MEIVKDVVAEEETHALTDGKYSQTFLAKVLAGKNEDQIKEILGFVADGCDIVLETYKQPMINGEGLSNETIERFKVIKKSSELITYIAADYIGSNNHTNKLLRLQQENKNSEKSRMLSSAAFYLAFLALVIALISLLG